MSHAVHKVTHAVSHVFHEVGHGISHAAHEIVHHPLEDLAVAGGSLLIPGVGSALGLTSSAAGLASAGTMADTALGATAVASGASAGVGILGTLESASKIANIAGAGASVLGAMSKPKVNIPDPNLPIQAKPQPQAKKAPVLGTQKLSLLGNAAEGLFGKTKTVFDNSNFGKSVSSYKLSDVFSLL